MTWKLDGKRFSTNIMSAKKKLDTFSVLARFPDPLVFGSNWVGEPCYPCLCLNDSDTVSKIASSCRQRNQLWCRPGCTLCKLCTLCNAQISCDSTSDWADTNSEIVIIHPFTLIQRVPHKSNHTENSICVDFFIWRFSCCHCHTFIWLNNIGLICHIRGCPYIT